MQFVRYPERANRRESRITECKLSDTLSVQSVRGLNPSSRRRLMRFVIDAQHPDTPCPS